MGLAMRYLSKPNPRIRYVSDASYWIYIIHLPVVMALQTAVAQVGLPWFVKYPLILLVAYPLTLVSYRYLVRYTFIGRLLNGRRRKGESAEKAPETTPPVAAH